MTDTRAEVIDLIFGRWRSQILHAGVKLGVFEALADKSCSAAQVAERNSTDPVRTYRLCRALACIGVLKESGDRTFSLTEAGEFLRADHPHTLRGVTLLEEGTEHYRIWSHLPDLVREGDRDGFEREYGKPIFKYLASNPIYAEAFNDAMTSFSGGEFAMVKEALADCDFGESAHICDVAGGHGHLLCHLLEWKQGTRGTVYDLPVTFEQKDRLWAGRMGLENRCDYVAGDIFESIPVADIYFMKHILHDWDDGECLRILTNIHSASEQSARLFVAEYVVPGPETPHFAKLFDVHMMCSAGGAERTEGEYGDLFRQSGWKLVKTWYPASKMMGVVEAAKA